MPGAPITLQRRDRRLSHRTRRDRGQPIGRRTQGREWTGRGDGSSGLPVRHIESPGHLQHAKRRVELHASRRQSGRQIEAARQHNLPNRPHGSRTFLTFAASNLSRQFTAPHADYRSSVWHDRLGRYRSHRTSRRNRYRTLAHSPIRPDSRPHGRVLAGVLRRSLVRERTHSPVSLRDSRYRAPGWPALSASARHELSGR